MNKIDLFWERFLKANNYGSDTKYLEAFHFELTEFLANELLRLVLEGTKKATSSSLKAYEITDSRIPAVGDFSIVTDWSGNPKCVIETKNITMIPFKDITFDICKREGEDKCLETWRAGHIKFFKAEGRELGYEFNEELMVVFEDFEVVYREEN